MLMPVRFPRTGERGDQSYRDHVVEDTEYRDRPGHRLYLRDRRRASHEDIGSRLHQLRHRRGILLRGPLNAEVDGQILALDEACLVEFVEEGDELGLLAWYSDQHREAEGPVAFLRS